MFCFSLIKTFLSFINQNHKLLRRCSQSNQRRIEQNHPSHLHFPPEVKSRSKDGKLINRCLVRSQEYVVVLV